MVEIQGYYYAALVSASKMAKSLGDFEQGYRLSLRAAKFREAFIKAYWLPDKQWFAFALDANGADPRVTSNQGQLLFTGILNNDPGKVSAIVRRLFAPGMWTPFGIRTYSSENRDFNAFSYHLGSIWPHDNWIIAQGLKRLGFWKAYYSVENAQIAAARIFHGRIPELYFVANGKLIKDPEACVPQGWSSGGLLNFLATER